ncbi:Protein arginine methyltransferase NDUFAF7 homolog, mitochondrial [Linum perenne]
MLLRKLLLRRASVSGNLFLNHPIPESPFPSFTRCIRFNSSSQTQGPDDDFVGRQNVEEHPAATISVDRSGLYNPPEHSHEPTSESELVKHLKGIIKMIGVWVMCLWEQMGQPAKVNLVELGPGRGTLMVDLLRGATKFKNFTASLHIHLVECSPVLQKIQHQNLKCEDEDVAGEIGQRNTVTSITASPVSWYSSLEQVPSGSPTIILAHEFYDALPVHQFQKSSRGWSEKMVDVAEDSKLRFVLSPQPTPATLYLMKRCKWAGAKEVENLNQIEICPKAIDLTHSIAQRISSDGGAALIIDYGQNGVVSDSLQAIRKHKFVNILDDPGSADLSAYVDFASIKHTAEEASENVGVHGPMTQSQFLGLLGINFRVEALLERCTDEQAESLRTGYWRLVGEGEAPFWEGPDELTPIGMGSRYLAMAIVNKKQGVPAPFQ